MAKYKLVATSTTIIRTDDGSFIPADPDNADYQVYLGWLAAGNSPDAADPVVVPDPPPPADSLAALDPQAQALLATLGQLLSVDMQIVANDFAANYVLAVQGKLNFPAPA